jgi:hypothetical protein
MVERRTTRGIHDDSPQSTNKKRPADAACFLNSVTIISDIVPRVPGTWNCSMLIRRCPQSYTFQSGQDHGQSMLEEQARYEYEQHDDYTIRKIVVVIVSSVRCHGFSRSAAWKAVVQSHQQLDSSPRHCSDPRTQRGQMFYFFFLAGAALAGAASDAGAALVAGAFLGFLMFSLPLAIANAVVMQVRLRGTKARGFGTVVVKAETVLAATSQATTTANFMA